MGAGGRKSGDLSNRTLETLKPGRWVSFPAVRGAGRLQARATASGAVIFYYRYAAPSGERVRVPIGIFDPTGRNGLTLKRAAEEAGKLSLRYQAGQRDLRAVLDSEAREAERLRRAEEQEAESRATRQQATLGALLLAYVTQLARDGKASARAVERSLRLNVETAWPKLWATPADEVTADDMLVVVARLADADKLREAAKLRAYLRAAFAAAIRARQDAKSLPALRSLKIIRNPARDLAPIEGDQQARERFLSLAELRAYWARIEQLPGPSGALLRFHLLTGGQRVEQLSRLTMDDYDSDREVIRLRDTKGRRRTARNHDVPLIPEAALAMETMAPQRIGQFLFTVTAGQSGAGYATIQQRLRAVMNAMAEAGELEKGAFTVGDLRRTVETRLAAEGVSLEIRAQLQSHGLGGVQARFYDRHDYLEEKRGALELLYRIATGAQATVTPIRRREQA